MLHKSIALITILGVFILMSLSKHAIAQSASAFSSTWAQGSDKSNTLRVYTDVSYDETGYLGGRFGFSSAGFACQGAATSLVTSQDADGNDTAIVTGSVLYYSVINGVRSKTGIRATATLTLSALADGVTSSEGVEIKDLFGKILYSSNGLWDVTRGSISISL